jgi:predicted amidophosphoribosyltransferase
VSGCPVCHAGFRGVATCPRCGADLSAVMSLAVRAWRARENSRVAIGAGEWASARDLAAEAQRLHATPAGRALGVVTRCMVQGLGD